MRSYLMLTGVLALFSILPALALAAPTASLTPVSEAEALQIGWPSLAGPYGDFQPQASTVRYVDDLSKATVAWTSECRHLGICKQGTPFGKSFDSGKEIGKYLGEGAGRHPGNWAGAIVAEGKVFLSSFRPTGPFVECDFPDKVPAKVRLDAEDFVVAMDINTGKTLWLSAEPGGIIIGGGKRQGFQVAPVYSDGKIFSMGSTGRLFAYDATTGKQVWHGDIGGAFQRQDAMRTQVLDSLAKRKFAYPPSPAWHTSLVVAGKTLVVPTFINGGLRGVDTATGTTLWEVKGVGSNLATPSVYRSGGREYVLTANTAGEMRLLDPADGKELWKVTGLGPAYFTLSPSSDYVLVNVNPRAGKADGQERIPGFFGAYKISPTGATLAWKLPEKDGYGFACWMDTEARYQYSIRDGLAYLFTDLDSPNAPGRLYVVKVDTGEIVAEHVNTGSQLDQVGGLWYLIGDKIISRMDPCHGPTHGGRHPWTFWRFDGKTITRLPGTLDQVEFTNGYEVNMQYPIVAGRMFERGMDGTLVCYDLREPKNSATWSMQLQNGWAGLPPVNLRLFTADGNPRNAVLQYADAASAGLPYMQLRDGSTWEACKIADLKAANGGIAGTIDGNFGTHHWPIGLQVQAKGNQLTGTWTRRIPAMAGLPNTDGTITGRANAPQRVYPTGWLKDKPWTVLAPNPAGTTTWILTMENCVPQGASRKGLTLTFDYDGTRITRAAACAMSLDLAWHEVDAGKLRVENGKVTGEVTVIMNSDSYVTAGFAGRITIDATANGEALTGAYTAAWGMPLEMSGAVTGAITR